MNDVIGANIARLRKEKNMTQDQLANLMGISFQAVSKWENGLSSPDVSSFPMLADVFGVTIDELFGREAARREAPDAEPKNDELPWPDDDCLYAVLYHGHTLVGCGDTAENRRIEFCYEGPAMNIHSEFDVRVDGDVEGSIESGGTVTCDAVGGDVRTGGNVTCDDVSGSVSAGGTVTCDNVEGDVKAGGSVTCDNIEGNVTAGANVTCDSIGGSVTGIHVECESGGTSDGNDKFHFFFRN